MEEIAESEARGEDSGGGERGGKGKRPPLSLCSVQGSSSCKRLTQPFHASRSIQFPHPNSNQIHGYLSSDKLRGFLFSRSWNMAETIQRNRGSASSRPLQINPSIYTTVYGPRYMKTLYSREWQFVLQITKRRSFTEKERKSYEINARTLLINQWKGGTDNSIIEMLHHAAHRLE